MGGKIDALVDAEVDVEARKDDGETPFFSGAFPFRNHHHHHLDHLVPSFARSQLG